MIFIFFLPSLYFNALPISVPEYLRWLYNQVNIWVLRLKRIRDEFSLLSSRVMVFSFLPTKHGLWYFETLKLDKSSKQTTRCQFKIVNYPQKRVNQPHTPIWRKIKQMLASCHLLPVSKLQPIWLWLSPMLGICIDLLHKNIYNCFQEILKDCMKFCLTIRHNLDPVWSIKI